MIRYLLDTNIISDATKPAPSEKLETWMSNQPDSSLFISAITIGEVWKGILLLDEGAKKRRLHDWFISSEGPQALFKERVLPFDSGAALVWADHLRLDRQEGKQRNSIDVMIGSIAEHHSCTVATNNEKDFHRFTVFNPMK